MSIHIRMTFIKEMHKQNVWHVTNFQEPQPVIIRTSAVLRLRRSDGLQGSNDKRCWVATD